MGPKISFGSVKLTSPGKESARAIGHLDDKGAALGGEVFEGDYGTLTGYLAPGPAGTAYFSMENLSTSTALLTSLRTDGKTAWTADIGPRTTPTGIGFDGTSIMLLAGFKTKIDLAATTLTPVGSDDTFLARFAP